MQAGSSLPLRLTTVSLDIVSVASKQANGPFPRGGLPSVQRIRMQITQLYFQMRTKIQLPLIPYYYSG